MACAPVTSAASRSRGTIEIALPCRSRADTHRGIRMLDMGGISIGLRIDSDRPQSKGSAGSLDPKSDLAAIGYENGVEHGCSNDPQEWLASCDFVTSRDETASITPSRSAVTGLNIFIASTVQSMVPVVTAWPTVTKGGASGEGTKIDDAGQGSA